jgi:hypothetical protein
MQYPMFMVKNWMISNWPLPIRGGGRGYVENVSDEIERAAIWFGTNKPDADDFFKTS